MSQDVLGRSALDLVSGPLADLVQKLGGKNGEQWLADLNRFLRKEAGGAAQKRFDPEAAEDRRKALKNLEKYYLKTLVEDGMDGTNFDCAVFDAIALLEKQFCTP